MNLKIWSTTDKTELIGKVLGEKKCCSLKKVYIKKRPKS